MEVIKKGRKQAGWAKQFKCSGSGNGGGGCGATLLVCQSDIYQTSSSVHDETDYYTTFCCPLCAVETDISDPGVPLLGKRPTDAEKLKIIKKCQESDVE